MSMKKTNLYFMISFVLGILVFPLTGAGNDSKKPPASNPAGSTKNSYPEYDILDRDQIDNTDALAIPFDDSEVEDEEEINRLEGKDVFHLPHSR